jgi:hypothetical protein
VEQGVNAPEKFNIEHRPAVGGIKLRMLKDGKTCGLWSERAFFRGR